MKRLIFLYSILWINWNCMGQRSDGNLTYPVVGKPCPEFIMEHIQYYPKKKATLRDFRGKWLVLDFWNKSCGACITSFPHVNEIQKELGDKVQVVMVGMEDPQRKIEEIYARHRAKENLLMPCAFDSNLARRFDYLIAPRTVLIDDKGIVQCLTTTMHISEMRSFLAGEHPVLHRAYRMHEEAPDESADGLVSKIIPFNEEKPFAMYGNGTVDSDFLFRSILTQWKPEIKPIDYGNMKVMLRMLNPPTFFVLGADLRKLYFYAYFGSPGLEEEPHGKINSQLALEVADSSIFAPDYKTGKNIFCYSVNIPSKLATEDRIKEIMQRDLQNYFGFTVSVESRNCSCWKVVATEAGKNKLNTRGGESKYNNNASLYYQATNVPWEDVFNQIRGFGSGKYIFDETGIVGNVDINLDCKNCILQDINDLKKALQANYLDLVPMQREMQVIVIKDAKLKKS